MHKDCVEMLIKKATAVPVQDEILPESNTSHAHTTNPTAIIAQLPDLKVADSTSKLESKYTAIYLHLVCYFATKAVAK